MSANILTPLMLWKGFSVDSEPVIYSVLTKQKSDVVIDHFYINGRSTVSGVVRIYGVSAVPNLHQDAPVVIVFTDGRGLSEEKIATSIAKEGYRAFVINLYGKKQGKESYTIYPEDINYANFESSADNLYHVDKSVTKTCWYEWALAGRYAFNAIKEKVGDVKIGVVGVREFSTAVWHLTAFEKNIDCAVSLFGFGYDAYRKIHKFGDKLEPHFDDQTLMFVAGIESESYALHVKCPTLILTSTNSNKWSVDRAYDTATKIKDDIFKAVDYSVGYDDFLSNSDFENLKIFLKSMLNDDDTLIRAKAEIKAEVKQGKIEVIVTPEDEEVSEVSLYAAEEIVNPAKRSWVKSTDCENENGNYVFNYLPYADSEIAFFFAKIKLKNGFTFSTAIIPRKFTAKEIGVSHKSTIIFSGRNLNAESVFAPASAEGLFSKPKEEVVLKSGPMGILGVSSEKGLLTYKISALKDRPKEDAILMLDVFSKEENMVTISLTDSDGILYSCSANVNGGKVWFNLKFEKQRFKTQEGRILKSFDKLVKLQIDAIKPCLINNALWV